MKLISIDGRNMKSCLCGIQDEMMFKAKDSKPHSPVELCHLRGYPNRNDSVFLEKFASELEESRAKNLVLRESGLHLP